jgi:hypothetical protein
MVHSDLNHKSNRNRSSNDASGVSSTSTTTITTSSASDSNKRYKTGSLTDVSGSIDSNGSKGIMSIHDSCDEDARPTPTAVDTTSPPPPKYGSKSYWDERYQKQFMLIAQNILSKKEPVSELQQPDAITSISRKDTDIIDPKIIEDVTTLPYHSWYFTYDELRPIILPLLLGERVCQDIILQPNEKNDVDHEAKNDMDDLQNDETERDTLFPKGKKPENDSIEEEEGGDDEEDDDDEEGCGKDDDGEWEEVADADEEELESNDDDDEDGDEVPVRDGMAKDGPVSVLEIGCGDVPLGVGLAFEFRHLTATLLENTPTIDSTDNVENGSTGSNLSIISKIVCTDYSPIVIDMMKRQYCNSEVGINMENVKGEAENDVTTSDGSASVDKRSWAPLQFEVVDARGLPYDDNTFHMVLEKGALDAVLSDTVKGIHDCVQIVSECARVTRGCIIIVSHLNAHTPNGLGWLEEVVMEGLKKYSVRATSNVASWDIEVHGNAEVVDEEENATKNSSFPAGTTGPAVYVIHKTMKGKTVDESTTTSTLQQSEVVTSIVAKNGNIINPSDDDVLDIVPINVRFFSY